MINTTAADMHKLYLAPQCRLRKDHRDKRIGMQRLIHIQFAVVDAVLPRISDTVHYRIRFIFDYFFNGIV